MSVYTLEEATSSGPPEASGSSSSSSDDDEPAFCWSSQGLSATLQTLYSEVGSLDGGLCLGTRVLCTWAEREVLRPGAVYVVKAFRPEVVRVWQRHFHGSTPLQLCLRVRAPPLPRAPPPVCNGCRRALSARLSYLSSSRATKCLQKAINV